MVEIKPMLFTEVWDKSVLKDDSKWYQIKENGIRALIHIKDGKIVGIRNRSNMPIFYLFPEFKTLKFPFSSGILDAEIVVMKNGKSIYYGGIDQRRSVPSKKVLENHPAKMIIFDALQIDGNVLIMKPYKHRYEQLNVLQENTNLSVAKNYGGEELWNKVISEDLEGVVIKNPNTPYELGKRSKENLKLKNYKLLDVAVTKIEPNEKGSKIFGKAGIQGKEIEVECQIGGEFDLETGSIQKIKYLDICKSRDGHYRLIQPTKVSRQQIQSCTQIKKE